MKRKNLYAPSLIFIDHDQVEHGNVGRQLFTDGDVGQNKAEVLARRFNMALGLNIEARPHMLRPTDFHDGQYHYSRPGTLLIGAVDNDAARRLMHDHIRYVAAWIDCGNHEHGGQVAIGNDTTGWLRERESWTRGRRTVKQMMTYQPNGDRQYKILPAPTLLFPELLEPEPEGLSCAQMVERNRQALLINDAMAIAAMNYVHKLLMREPVQSFVTYVDLTTNNMRSVPLTSENLRRALGQATRSTTPRDRPPKSSIAVQP